MRVLLKEKKPKPLELHRMLTFFGLILLIATFAIHYYYEESNTENEFNYAYITGITMLIVFMASFAMFNMDRWKKSRK